MIYLPDTHALAWLLNADPRLSTRARSLLEDRANALAVPIIVAAELHDMFRRNKVYEDFPSILQALRAGRDCEVVAMDEAVLQHIPAGFDIHDSWILATAFYLGQTRAEPNCIISRDLAMRRIPELEIVW